MSDVMSPKKWDRLARTPRRLAFIQGLRRGLTVWDAFKRAKLTGDCKAAASYFLITYEKFPELLEKYASKKRRGEVIRMLTEMKVARQLSSKDAEERNNGIKHARAIYGLDEPKQEHLTVESPHLDKRKLVPLIPARERFGVN